MTWDPKRKEKKKGGGKEGRRKEKKRLKRKDNTTTLRISALRINQGQPKIRVPRSGDQTADQIPKQTYQAFEMQI